MQVSSLWWKKIKITFEPKITLTWTPCDASLAEDWLAETARSNPALGSLLRHTGKAWDATPPTFLRSIHQKNTYDKNDVMYYVIYLYLLFQDRINLSNPAFQRKTVEHKLNSFLRTVKLTCGTIGRQPWECCQCSCNMKKKVILLHQFCFPFCSILNSSLTLLLKW